MQVQIVKDIDSVHGTFRPGQVVDLPANVAEAWLKKQVVAVVPAPGKSEVIPEGMFWCEKHETLHKLDSSKGRKCLKRQVKEKEKKEAEKKEQSTDKGSQGEQGDGENESSVEEDEEEEEES